MVVTKFGFRGGGGGGNKSGLVAHKTQHPIDKYFFLLERYLLYLHCDI